MLTAVVFVDLGILVASGTELFDLAASHSVVIPREGGGSSTPRPIDSITDVSEYWVAAGACHRAAIRPTRWRVTTIEYDFAISPHHLRESCLRTSRPPKTDGAGKTGCTLHPRSRVQYAQTKAHTSIQVQAEHPGLPCAVALRLTSSSSR